MFQSFVTALLIAGACSAYSHEEKTTVGPFPPTGGFIDPESGHIDPVRGPVDAERGPVDPERYPVGPVHPVTFTLHSEKGPVVTQGAVDPGGPFTSQNIPVSAEVPEVSAPQDAQRPEGDLKTDATFWPFYRSLWGYPSYTRRNYSTYPYYRYYRPRTYYRYW